VELVELIHLVVDHLVVQIQEMEEAVVTAVFLLEDQVDLV
jgi:hypothetical protein